MSIKLPSVSHRKNEVRLTSLFLANLERLVHAQRSITASHRLLFLFCDFLQTLLGLHLTRVIVNGAVLTSRASFLTATGSYVIPRTNSEVSSNTSPPESSRSTSPSSTLTGSLTGGSSERARSSATDKVSDQWSRQTASNRIDFVWRSPPERFFLL